MTRTMYDGINALTVPPGGDLYAGYIDGHWPSANAISQRFPHALVVRIATSAATNDGVCLDCEQGDATPEEAVNWVLERRHAGVDPTVYCGESAWPTVRAAFATHDVPEPHWWVARYSPVTAIPASAVALQHTSTAGYDVSSVADYWPGVDPAPHPAAAAASQEDEMSTTSVNGRAGLSWPAGTRHVVQVTYDPAPGDPVLRVVWALTTGPLVASLTPAHGTGTVELAPEHVAACRGVILARAAGPAVVFDACAV